MRRIFFGLGLLVLLLLMGCAGYPAARLLGLYLGSHVVVTARGPVEIARVGAGPPVLILHGLVGGYDQGLLLSDALVDHGFEVISVSRPGYLRTPLATGATPEEQADALSALLMTLKIPHATVVGLSAGGMSAIEMAVRHPDQVRGLVLFSAVATVPDLHQAPDTARLGGGFQDFHPYRWDGYQLLGSLAVRFYPRKTLLRVLDVLNVPSAQNRRETVEAVLHSHDQRALLDRLVDSAFPISGKIAGIRNDLRQISALKSLPLEQITVPTLIVHGEADRILPFAGALAAQKRIPGSVLFPVPGGGHIVLLGPHDQEVNAALLEFCRSVSGK